LANEFFRHFGADVSVNISPRGEGILEVFLDGETIYDRAAEGGKYPDLLRVRDMLVVIRAKMATLEPVAADD
jgi:predicted Rdx family selenoprotein